MHGIFNDEGLLEGDFTEKQAKTALEAYYADDDPAAYVAECCHDHPEHEAGNCEECNAEGES